MWQHDACSFAIDQRVNGRQDHRVRPQSQASDQPQVAETPSDANLCEVYVNCW